MYLSVSNPCSDNSPIWVKEGIFLFVFIFPKKRYHACSAFYDTLGKEIQCQDSLDFRWTRLHYTNLMDMKIPEESHFMVNARMLQKTAEASIVDKGISGSTSGVGLEAARQLAV